MPDPNAPVQKINYWDSINSKDHTGTFMDLFDLEDMARRFSEMRDHQI